MAPWFQLCMLPTVQACKEHIAKDTDGGGNPNAEWRRKPGGDAGRITYVCEAHTNCTVLRRIMQKSGGAIVCGTTGVEHAAEPKLFDRPNAWLTKEQKALALQGMRWGAAPADVRLAANQAAVAGGAKILDEGGVEGAASPNHLTLPLPPPHMLHLLQRILIHLARKRKHI